MSESEDQNAEATPKKKGSALGLILIVVVLLAIIFGLSAYKNLPFDISSVVEEEGFVATIAQEDNSAVNTDGSKPSFDISSELDGTNVDVTNFDLNDAATPRILGNPDAPIKISEHSSFTCGGCAGFHKDNFKKIKQDFIDTGKAYIVFDDFPRNRYDITVGAIARCVSTDSYFDFVQLLFETQKTWLNDDYIKHVQQNALLSGATEAELENCLGNEELYKALADRQKLANDTYDVNQTPTLVINDTFKLNGLMPYAEIKAALEGQLSNDNVSDKAEPSAEVEVVE